MNVKLNEKNGLLITKMIEKLEGVSATDVVNAAVESISEAKLQKIASSLEDNESLIKAIQKDPNLKAELKALIEKNKIKK